MRHLVEYELRETLQRERVWRLLAMQQRDLLVQKYNLPERFPRMEDYMTEKEVTVIAEISATTLDGKGFAEFTHEYENVKLSVFDVFQAKGAEASFKAGARAKALVKVAGERRLNVTVLLRGFNKSTGFRAEFVYKYYNVRESVFDILQGEGMAALFAVGADLKAATPQA